MSSSPRRLRQVGSSARRLRHELNHSCLQLISVRGTRACGDTATGANVPESAKNRCPSSGSYNFVVHTRRTGLSQLFEARRVSNFVESGFGWSCFTLRLCSRLSSVPAVSITEKVVRDPGRSTQASLSSQGLTSIPQRMEEDAFDGHCSHPPRERSIVCLCVQTRVDDLFSNIGTCPDFRIVREYPRTKSELRAHQMARKLRSAGFTPHKIRAELSSNGSQLELRTAGLTPHFHAELL